MFLACAVQWGASLQKPRMSFGDFLGIFLGIFREIEDFKDFKAFVPCDELYTKGSRVALEH